MQKEQIQRLRAVCAETIGTFILSLSVAIASHMFGLGTAAWYVSLTAGLALVLVISMFGGISGAHVNPAVTIGLWTLKKIDTPRAILYIASQMLGGALALLFYNSVAKSPILSAATSNIDWKIFAVEAVGAALFGMGIIIAVSQKTSEARQAFIIGVSLTFAALAASIAAPGYLNPTVALANNALGTTLLIAPIVGMVFGMNFANFVFINNNPYKSKK